MDIVCLGELLVDMFPAELGRRLADVSAFRPKPGGAPANVAVAAARLGAQSAFIGKVGDDAFGHHLADVLRQEGVDIRGMRFDEEARTTMAFIAMPDENTAEFVFYRNPGADVRLQADELDGGLLQEARAFHFGSLSLTHEPSRGATMEAVKIAREAGALISFDVNYRPSLWRGPDEAYEAIMAVVPHADLLKVNEVEVALLVPHHGDYDIPRPRSMALNLAYQDHFDGALAGSEDLNAASKFLLEQGPDLCVVTLGPDGSFFQVADGGEHVPAFKVQTVDATGCGDAFVAGLLCQLVASDNWRDQLSPVRMRNILRYANAVGALTSLTQGVIPALPAADQVDEFLARN
jgi:fructokinase